jgi:hypothetical protein
MKHCWDTSVANTLQINAKFLLVSDFNNITAQPAAIWLGFGLT